MCWQCSITKKTRRSGIAMVAALIFIMVFMAMSAGMLSMSSANTQTAQNHRSTNEALNAAMSGLEWARYQVLQLPVVKTSQNTVSDTEANERWTALRTRLTNATLGGQALISQRFTDANGSGDELLTGQADFGQGDSAFQLRFFRYDADPRVISLQSTGLDDAMTRAIRMDLEITKSADVLNYALAGRGRMWLTGDTTIHGSIYSSYGYKSDGSLQSMAPFNMTSDSIVEGTINTVLSKDQIATRSYDLETLGANGNAMFEFGEPAFDLSGNSVSATSGPVDEYGNLLFTDSNGDLSPVFDAYGNPITYNNDYRVYSSGDEIQGYHEGINYGQPDQSNVAGLNISDYETSSYKNAIPSTTVSAGTSVIQNGVLSKSGVSTVTEYFPHAPLSSGGYTTAASSSSLKVTRYKYENKTIRDVVVSKSTNALFKNCTFEGVLYVECTSSYYNNIRFEDCTFNGTIVTSTPSSLSWQKNALYFTGAATFENQTDVPATILAPNFNVDLGNTNPNSGDNNVLTGAIVGGIVDIRGNAEIYGTIISMADTSSYTSGYVTNIGVTLDDGGSETTEVGDIGTIEITPNPDQLLPSGITTPVILKPKMNTYAEVR